MERGGDQLTKFSSGAKVATESDLASLFERHRGRLLAMLRRRIDPSLTSRVEPEDILSEAFLRARSELGSTSAIGGYGWLYRIALDQLIAVWRREARAKRDYRLEMPWPDRSSFELGMRLARSALTPSGVAIRQEDIEHVRRVLELLRDEDREILGMRYYDSLSFGEMATVLGISTNAATLRCARALRRLKGLWQHLCD